jgi:tryptophanyl-tRNA synthetase
MNQRVLSGMRPTGALHLGHYHGALKNWVRLQGQYECFYFVADWHALTTHYEDRETIEKSVYDMVVDWLAAGLDPERSTIFIQSRLPEHAELFTLLAMGTPLGWLERVPTYKDQMEKLKDRDLATYGFLGYPLLQAADILIYKAAFVPVGEDQASHVELTRELARRFNHLYGRVPGFAQRVAAALAKLPRDDVRYLEKQRRDYQEAGKAEALTKAEGVVNKAAASIAGWTSDDTDLLLGHVKGTGKTILPEPAALHTEVTKLPGLDGQKMSKSYGNTIDLTDDADTVTKKVRQMYTDPKRIRADIPGTVEGNPVFMYHDAFNADTAEVEDLKARYRAGTVGDVEVKTKLAKAMNAMLEPMRERRRDIKPERVREIAVEGSRKARAIAQQTMERVRDAVKLRY